MIKTSTRPYYAMPDSVHKRIDVLAAVHDCIQSALIGQAVAKFEGGYGCPSCGVYIDALAALIGDKPTGKPPKPNSLKWLELAEEHTAGCKWILTRGFQI